jgi:ZIP family zinc transporter
VSNATITVPARDRPPRVPLWFKGVAPLVLIALLVFAFFRLGPVGILREGFPPVEVLTIERITLPGAGEMRVRVVNGGPEPVTIAQVLVDDAAWSHTLDGDRILPRLQSRTITIPYPWVQGEPHVVKVISSTGLVFEGDIAVATRTPTADATYLATFALIGLYVGVIPVLLGLLWVGFLRQVGQRWIDFFLSLTIGLLVFLGVEAAAESLETSAAVAGAFQGLALVLVGLIGTPLVITAIGHRGKAKSGERSAMYVATLIAFGIGLHNLGEGLAIGTSYSNGEIALGTFLMIGFLLHNTTEGLAIVAPLSRQRASLSDLLMLGAIAGVPTILGAWIGAFTYSPVWTTLFLAIGAGAVVQVVYELWKFFAKRAAGLAEPLNAAGLLIGFAIMYGTGLLVSF